jgi:hypothetical protein
LHFLQRVLAIRIDADDGHALAVELGGQFGQSGAIQLGQRALGADEATITTSRSAKSASAVSLPKVFFSEKFSIFLPIGSASAERASDNGKARSSTATPK